MRDEKLYWLSLALIKINYIPDSVFGKEKVIDIIKDMMVQPNPEQFLTPEEQAMFYGTQANCQVTGIATSKQ